MLVTRCVVLFMLALNGIFSSNTFTDWLLIMHGKILFLFCLGLLFFFFGSSLLENNFIAEHFICRKTYGSIQFHKLNTAPRVRKGAASVLLSHHCLHRNNCYPNIKTIQQLCLFLNSYK